MLRYVLMLLAPGVVLLGLALQNRITWLRKLSQNLLITYTMIALLIGGAEIYLRYFFAQSENVFTWANANWLDRYWETNSFDFRDPEWDPADWEGKTTVAIVGDSFAVGWGINDPEDRYGNVLADHLGDDYAVVNLGRYGTATTEQLDILKNAPLNEPDIVVMQYYINDINYALLSMGMLPIPPDAPRIVQKSALANFIFYRFQPLFLPNEPDWREITLRAYDNAPVWERHQAEIREFLDYIEEIDARLILIIFPDMLDPMSSIPYVDRVAQYFESQGYTETLKLFDEVARWELEERIVSFRDTHPSPAFHRRVGDMIYAEFFDGDLTATEP